MKSRSQIIRSKKRLCIYLLKLSARGEEIQINLRNLISEIYNETGEIFAQTGYGIVFESFIRVDADNVCNSIDKTVGCGEGFDIKSGICSSKLHKPKAPILLPPSVDQYPDDFNPFPGNLFTVTSVLPTVKPLPGLKKHLIVKFRRDFGKEEMRKNWPKNLAYERYNVKNSLNDGMEYGICDVIK